MAKPKIKQEAAQVNYRPVKAAYLHTALVWPGGALNAQTSLIKEKCPDIKMCLLPDGLLVQAKGKQTLVPYPNVVNCVLEEKVDL